MRKFIRENLVFLIISAIIILPVLIFAGNSIPSADDFCIAVDMRDGSLLKYPSMIMAAIYESIKYYKEWGGYFFATFLTYYFNPLIRGGITALRLFNVSVYMVFFSSLYILTYVFSKYILKIHSKKISSLLYVLLIYIIVNGYLNGEIYTWYNAISAYVLPISFMFVSLIFFVIGIAINKRYCIISAIIAFFVSGSSLNITALNCGLIFIFSIYVLIDYNEKKWNSIIFLSSIVGGLLNVFAPGNYVRRGKIVDGSDIIFSIKGSIVATTESFADRIIKTPYVLFGIFLLVICIIYVDYSKSKLKFKYPIIMACIVWIGVFIVNFPPILGYLNKAVVHYAGRIVFVQDITIYFLTSFFVIYLAGYIKNSQPMKKYIIKKEALIYLGVSTILFMQLLISNVGTDNITTSHMISSIVYGRLRNTSEYYIEMLSNIESSGDNDVILMQDAVIEGECCLKTPALLSDTSSFVNVAVSKYYQKNSISIIGNKVEQ